MIVGVLKEIKTREYRVGMVPAGVQQLVQAGHTVLVESGAGLGSGIADDNYKSAGASLISSSKEIWERADMVIKVKEPIEREYAFMREQQIIYTYFHLAADKKLAEALMKTKATAVAYETIQLADGSLPLLRPMSEVAGKMSVQVGAKCLEKEAGGKGILLGGIPGVKKAKVTIIGGGVVGFNATLIAVGMGANVTVLDVNIPILNHFENVFRGCVQTLYSDPHTIAKSVKNSDLVIGAVLVTGAKAPTLVSRELISQMSAGSVIVDVAVDQGGCVETCRPTTHDNPTYEVDGVVHYCVANMPGAVAHTSTIGLTNSTFRYALEIANKGLEKSVRENAALLKGINSYKGNIVYKAVSDSLNLPYVPIEMCW